MSSISEHSLPARRKVRRLRIRDARSRPHARAADRAGAIPIMGPANRAPGTSIMGAPGRTVDVMGGADSGPRVSVMGPRDRGPRLDLLGESDLRFVDSLFTSVRGDW
jgi:hypothetical protein